MVRRLGKLPARHDSRTFKLSRYVERPPAPPPARDWTDKASASWGMMRNDAIGDCMIAAEAHTVQAWTSLNGGEVTVGDADVVKAYGEVSGYNPADPTTDAGCVMLDAMRHWRSTGVGGHKIEAFVSVDHSNRLELETAINLFGGVIFGFDLPLASENLTVWDVAPPGGHDATWARNSWGGHAVGAFAYSRTGVVIVTWGALKFVTWEFVFSYTSECFAGLSPEWVGKTATAPNGFNLDQLRTDLANLAA